MYENMPYYSDEELDEKTEAMSDEDRNAYGDYKSYMKAKGDVRCLAEAQEIRDDKERLKKAVHCAKTQKKHLDSIV